MAALRDAHGPQVARHTAPDRDFHRILLEPAVQAVGRRLLDQLGTVAERYVRMSVAAFRADELSSHDHDSLLDAFVAGDGDLAAQETVHHLNLVETSIVEALSDLQ